LSDQQSAGRLDQLAGFGRALKTLAGAGVLAPQRPDRVAKSVSALRRFGPTTAAALESWDARDSNRVAVIDDAGVHSYGELNRRSSAVAAGLYRSGLQAGDAVGLLCRNHAGFIVALGALARIGADTVLLNTGFAGPQLADVADREGVKALILDEEFLAVCSEISEDVPRILGWQDDNADRLESLDSLARQAVGSPPPAPEKPGRTVILTSGTTGTPKGANRGKPPSLFDGAVLLEAIPLKSGDISVISAPVFHSWGFVNLGLGLALGATIILRRRFDPAEVVVDLNRFNATVLVVVPVMLSRVLELPSEASQVAPGALRIIALSGSALPGDLAKRGLDRFGPVLYNLYGSTEVAWATIAGPADLRAAPGTAGRPPRGTVLRLLDEDGVPVPDGERGRIFVGNKMLFEGYTGGGTKAVESGLMATGDVGTVDPEGRLFVEGRDDDMIISGGENVFPEEVENCILQHSGVLEAAVVGVDDEEFGQRLRAVVVLRSDSQLDESELREHVRGHLARYKVPREVKFVEQLPRNETGKVLRRSLRD